MTLQHTRSHAPLFIVEGNIGAGKSTFVNMIRHYLNMQVVLEPHHRWQQIADGHNLLEAFYQNPSRWAYTFQLYAFVTRIMEQQEHAQRNQFPAQLLERSVFSDRYCFAQNCYEMGTMTALEWQLYQNMFSWLVQVCDQQPTGFIYVRTTPERCYERLHKRSRHEEATIPLSYLQRVHDRHEAWLIDKLNIDERIKEIPVLVLDGNVEFETDRAQQEKYVEKIVAFCATYMPQGLYKQCAQQVPL